MSDKIDCFLTKSYKCGYIYSKNVNNMEVVQFRVDRFAYIQYAKSWRSAQIIITKHYNKLINKVK